MDLSIVIVNYNSGELIINCLSSIYSRIEGLDFEVIIIDNFSTDGSVLKIKGLFPQVRLLECEKNYGFAGACNKGLEMSCGNFILMLNPDIIIKENFSIHSLINYMNKHEKVGVAGCKLINIDGTVQNSCRRFPDIITIIFRRIKFFQRFSFAKARVENYLVPFSDYNVLQKTDWLLGAFLLIKRQVLTDVGFFDKRFFMYFEDVDFCRRVWDKGYEIFYYPHTEVTHYHKRESARGINKLLFYHILSGIKYFFKWL